MPTPAPVMGIKPLPREVRWTERDKKTKKVGRVVKEAAIVERFPWGDYYKVVQEIREDSGKSFIRFGYYKKNHGEPDKAYTWGSQTTLAIQRENLRKLLSLAKDKGII